MDIKRFFLQMNQKIDDLNQHVEEGILTSEELEVELEALKLQSEEVVEEWLQFEEKLSAFIKHKLQPQNKDTSWTAEQFELAYEMLTQVEPAPLYPAIQEEWKKGKAFYELEMYQDALTPFRHILEEEPDFEHARLFLGYTYMALANYEQASYHLAFLAEITSDIDVLLFAIHGLACSWGLQGNLEKALHVFDKVALNELDTEWQAIFLYNRAQTLYGLKRYAESLEQWLAYYQLEPSDWVAPYMAGKVHILLHNEEDALAYWFEALQLDEHVKLLREMAIFFEHKNYYKMAIQCYTRILGNRNRSHDQEAWHGLAWNYGLHQQKEKSEGVFKKAISLFPDHLELQISYTWMLMLWNQYPKAKKSLELLRKKDGYHPLVQSLEYLFDGNVQQALELLSDSSLN